MTGDRDHLGYRNPGDRKPKDRATLEQAEIILRKLGNDFLKHMPKGWRFAIYFHSDDTPGYTTYLSNMSRDSFVEATKELIGKIEREEKPL